MTPRPACSSHFDSLRSGRPMNYSDAALGLASCNGTAEVVLSGDADAIADAADRCHGIDVTPLSVSHAFQSPYLATAAPAFDVALGNMQLNVLTDRTVVSTVSRQRSPATFDEDSLRRTNLRRLAFFVSCAHDLPAEQFRHSRARTVIHFEFVFSLRFSQV
jgi:acyl transferase domain-containing protein